MSFGEYLIQTGKWKDFAVYLLLLIPAYFLDKKWRAKKEKEKEKLKQEIMEEIKKELNQEKP